MNPSHFTNGPIPIILVLTLQPVGQNVLNYYAEVLQVIVLVVNRFER